MLAVILHTESDRSMPHILFISYDGMTDPLGQSQVIPYLSGLAKYGYRFTIISCEKKERFQNHKEKIYALLSPFQIKWIPLLYHKSPPVFSAIYDLKLIKETARKLYNDDPFDMVHTRSGTPALAGLWLKRKFGIKFLNDIRDFYSQSRIDSGQWKQNNPVYRMVYNYFRKKEEQELAISDGIVCLTQKAEQITKSKKEYRDTIPLKVIPCSVDLNLFDPQNINLNVREVLKKKFNFQDSDIVFSYLGSVGTWYLTNEMFLLFKEIQRTIIHSKFLIITPDDPKLISRLSEENGINSEKISITSATRTEVPTLLSLSNYSVFFIKSCFSKQASSPTKLGEIMAMGIPVITNSGVGDVKEIVQKYEAGIVLEDLTPENFKKTTSSLLRINFDTNKIRTGAKDYFDLQNAVHNYKDLYESILEPNWKFLATSKSFENVIH